MLSETDMFCVGNVSDENGRTKIMKKIQADIVVIGGGTAGMGAFRNARLHSDNVYLIENNVFGTTCARVGCMPSKLLIAAAEARHHALHTDPFGVHLDKDSIVVNGEEVMRRVKSERDRFGIVSRLEFYENRDLTTIVSRSAQLLQLDMGEEGAMEVAKRSRGTPRIANRLLRRVRDFADVKNNGVIDAAVADAALSMLDVDAQGLDVMDRKFLEAVLHKFGGGPVGLDNVAAAIGESTDTIEDVIEPYLIQQGFLQRTPRGRMATERAYLHFGLPVEK